MGRVFPYVSLCHVITVQESFVWAWPLTYHMTTPERAVRRRQLEPGSLSRRIDVLDETTVVKYNRVPEDDATEYTLLTTAAEVCPGRVPTPRVGDAGSGPGSGVWMEYVSDQTLWEYRRAASDVKHVLVRECIATLDCLHRHQMVHRDIKVDNILVRSGGGQLLPVFIDFGLSCVEAPGASGCPPETRGVGTWAYQHPYVRTRHHVMTMMDWKVADRFSLAVSLLQLYDLDEPTRWGPGFTDASMVAWRRRVEATASVPEELKALVRGAFVPLPLGDASGERSRKRLKRV